MAHWSVFNIRDIKLLILLYCHTGFRIWNDSILVTKAIKIQIWHATKHDLESNSIQFTYINNTEFHIKIICNVLNSETVWNLYKW